MKHKQKVMCLNFVSVYSGCVSVVWVDSVVADRGLLALCCASCAGSLFLIFKGDPELKRQQEKDLQRQNIRELEEDLGYEPLNLEELAPIFEEIEKERRKGSA